MTKWFKVRSMPIEVDTALLLLRLFVGIAFMLHGWGKIQNPFGWMQGAPVPGIFQALAALSEFGGGLALIIGLLFRLANLGLFFTMLVASAFHLFVMKDPVVKMTQEGGSAEPAIVYMLIAFLFLMTGPGRFSLDKKIFK